MPTDTRPRYIWFSVILANTIFFLAALTLNMPSTKPLVAWNELIIGSNQELILMGILLLLTVFCTAVPVLISRAKSPMRHYFGYGISVLFALATAYFVWHYFTCEGKFCNLLDIFLAPLSVLAAVLSAGFYTLGRKAATIDQKWILRFIILELIVIVFLGVRFIGIINTPPVQDYYPADAYTAPSEPLE